MNTDLNERLKQYQRNYYTSEKRRKWNINFLYSIKMNEKKLKFDNVEVNKKESHVSKQSVSWNLSNVNQILISDKFKNSYTDFKYFIGYKDGLMM